MSSITALSVACRWNTGLNIPVNGSALRIPTFSIESLTALPPLSTDVLNSTDGFPSFDDFDDVEHPAKIIDSAIAELNTFKNLFFFIFSSNITLVC